MTCRRSARWATGCARCGGACAGSTGCGRDLPRAYIQPRAAPEHAGLHALREANSFIGKKKLLQLHFQMVGQDSIEAAVFGRHVDYVRQKHPEATVPGLVADEKLFAAFT